MNRKMNKAREAREARHEKMGKPCGRRCSKAYLVLFNFVFMICGSALLGLGIWMKIDQKPFLALHIAQGLPHEPLYGTIPYIMMGVGASMFLVCIAGACGACKHNACCLCLYSVILLLLMLAQIGIIIAALVNKEQLEDHITNKLLQQVRISYNRSEIHDVNNTNILTNAWDSMQVKLKCCGATGPDDYMFSTWWNHTTNSAGMAVPHTCCSLYNDNPEVPMVRDNNQCQIEGFIYKQWKERPEEVGPLEDLHTKGCVVAVLEWIDQYSHIIVAVLVTAILLQLLGLITSCLLVTRLKKHVKDHDDV